jgi:alkylation response protein AidB-like acyl-CoA dehydrogenase
MLIDVELATSAAYAAGWAIDDAAPDVAVLSRLAHAHCAEAAGRVAADTIEVHGGIGFTWEHPAHLYYKRAAASASLLGPASAHRRVLADLLNV